MEKDKECYLCDIFGYATNRISKRSNHEKFCQYST